ncbi:hypothetical protein BRADI_1g14421v3 [Brachypodium distachyon]|uniref:Uncharacterized protein n=1 Tax=Brachypodium distachyon TaxID=15368 RepID=A0A2K2DJF3_BRADI|nr:hypothetical protein BRADI_1g14421v3 [Brachypodium distachyon]
MRTRADSVAKDDLPKCVYVIHLSWHGTVNFRHVFLGYSECLFAAHAMLNLLFFNYMLGLQLHNVLAIVVPQVT